MTSHVRPAACSIPYALVAALAVALPCGAAEAPFLVTQLPAGKGIEKASGTAGMLRAEYGEGARIVLVAPGAAARVVTEGFHSACDPDVSFDGKRFLFAGKRAAGDAWDIFEAAVDGSAVRQITKGLGDCRSPGYQSTQYVITAAEPWYQITFVGTRHGAANEVGGGAASALYSCRLDGSEVKRLTYNLSSDFDPAIKWDGRLLYATWQRSNLDRGVLGRVRLFDVNTDGSDYAAFIGPAGKRIQHMPCTTPAGLAVFVETDAAPWDGAGTLAAVELRRPLHTYRPLTAAADGLFHSPSPLPDGRLLVARRPADGSATLGVVRFDPRTKQCDALYDDPAWHDIQPKAIYAREEPDGRSSVVSEGDKHGRLYCLNIYQTDLKDPAWRPGGAPRRLRVLEGVPKKPHAVESGNDAALALRRLLGEVAIERDGSFNLEVPANTPIELQVLDENGLALRSCGWIWARSHQSQGCIGCHEDGELVPHNYVTESLAKDSLPVSPPVEERRTVDFRRDLAPVVAAKCVACHDQAGSPPNLAGDARAAYSVLLATAAGNDADRPLGKYVQPGRARTSPLIWHLFGANTSRPWDGPATRLAAKPLAPGKVEPLTIEERRLFVEWIDLGAAWERPAL